MAKEKPPGKAAAAVPEAEPIILVGQPGALRGELFLQNSGEERLVFRGAQMHSAPVAKAARAAEAFAVTQKLPAVIVRPGEQRKVPLKVALASTTPPGEYRAEIKLAERAWPVVMHVTEKVALSISPDSIVIRNEPGASITKRVLLRNLGNVPLVIEELAAIPLDDELLQCRLLRAVVAALDVDKDQTIESVLTQFARQSRVILNQAGILRVRNRSGRLTLEPGAVQPLDLELRVPESLDKRSRYRALLPIYTADIDILIVPSFDIQSSEKGTTG
jgi:hypothetical protein